VTSVGWKALKVQASRASAFVASMHIRRRTDAFGVRIFVGGCAQARHRDSLWTNCAEHVEGGLNLMLRLTGGVHGG
jgi:hypothetical protein